MKVALFGAGERVEALATLFAAVGGPPARWTGAPADADPAALTAEADLAVVAVTPDAFRDTLAAMRPGPATRLLVASRGLEPGGERRLSAIVEAETACLRVGALAGPILPGEVRRGAPCAAVVASRFDEVANRASEALHSRSCRVYASHDLVGVELSGALVEVLTAALGVARGLGFGAGLQAMVVTCGLAEGGRLLARAGADPRTFTGLAGAGELIAAMSVPDDEGLRRGLALARGERDPALAELAGALGRLERDLPITLALGAVARGDARAADVLGRLFERGQRGEEFGR